MSRDEVRKKRRDLEARIERLQAQAHALNDELVRLRLEECDHPVNQLARVSQVLRTRLECLDCGLIRFEDDLEGL